LRKREKEGSWVRVRSVFEKIRSKNVDN